MYNGKFEPFGWRGRGKKNNKLNPGVTRITVCTDIRRFFFFFMKVLLFQFYYTVAGFFFFSFGIIFFVELRTNARYRFSRGPINTFIIILTVSKFFLFFFFLRARARFRPTRRTIAVRDYFALINVQRDYYFSLFFFFPLITTCRRCRNRNTFIFVAPTK